MKYGIALKWNSTIRDLEENNLEIREYTEYNEKEIVRLYTEVGWTAYTDNLHTLRRGFENSLLVLAAFENDELIRNYSSGW